MTLLQLPMWRWFGLLAVCLRTRTKGTVVAFLPIGTRTFGTQYSYKSHPRAPKSRASICSLSCLADTQKRADASMPRDEDSLEEVLLQNLWQQDPFEIANQLVKAVIQGSTFSLSEITNSSVSQPPMSKDMQDLFHRLLEQNPPPSSDDREQPQRSQANNNKDPKNGRQSFRLDIAYLGASFCGWQTQPLANNNNKALPSVQETLEDWLQPLYQPSRRVQQDPRRHDGKPQVPPRVDLRAAGRTDAGVHAVGQVARFRTWIQKNQYNDNADNGNHSSSSSPLDGRLQQKLLVANHVSAPPTHQLIQDYLNQHPMAGKDFWCVGVTPVSSQFHPTFGATCRAYLYVLDVQPLEELLARTPTTPTLQDLVHRLDHLLEPLVGHDLDYVALSYGKVKTQTTRCHLSVARPFLGRVSSTDDKDTVSSPQALCVQLVGNRFLRRMVRILVATALREAFTSLQDGDDDKNNNRLVEILESNDRRRAARPAPPQGLIFAGALFQEE